MQSVNGKNITLTRGDTFKATVNMTGPDGTAYVPDENDVIRFAMRKDFEDGSTVLIQKVVPNDTLLLTIEHAETAALGIGDYVWDLEITYANGDVDTFIDKGKLKLTEEVS